MQVSIWQRWTHIAQSICPPTYNHPCPLVEDKNPTCQLYQWLPKNYEATDVYYRFRPHFGSDEVTLVSWEGCTLDDPRLERFATAVEGKGNEPRSDSLADAVEHVTTGQRVQKQLSTRPLSIPRDEAIRRLQAVLIGPDGQTTCAVVTLSADTSRQRIAAVDAIRQRVEGTLERRRNRTCRDELHARQVVFPYEFRQ